MRKIKSFWQNLNSDLLWRIIAKFPNEYNSLLVFQQDIFKYKCQYFMSPAFESAPRGYCFSKLHSCKSETCGLEGKQKQKRNKTKNLSNCPYLDWEIARRSSILNLMSCYAWRETADWEVYFRRWILCLLTLPNDTIYISILLMWTNPSFEITIVRAQTWFRKNVLFKAPDLPVNTSFL